MRTRIIRITVAAVATVGLTIATSANASAIWEWKIPCDKHVSKMC